jgi:hypothetical protein
MSRISGANLFKEPAQWPLLPPWWLLAAPRAAALLNVTSATLQNWRVRGEGPEPVPPMYLKPTQGDPIYYRYTDIRSWAATRLGLSYTFDDQCVDFFNEVCPNLNGGTGSNLGRAKTFDMLFSSARSEVRVGNPPIHFDLKTIEGMDIYYSRQPKRLK